MIKKDVCGKIDIQANRKDLWQGSSAGESARLIPVRSRVRISPLLFFCVISRAIRLCAASKEAKSYLCSSFHTNTLWAHDSLSFGRYLIVCDLTYSLRKSGRWNKKFCCRISKCDLHNYLILILCIIVVILKIFPAVVNFFFWIKYSLRYN